MNILSDLLCCNTVTSSETSDNGEVVSTTTLKFSGGKAVGALITCGAAFAVGVFL